MDRIAKTLAGWLPRKLVYFALVRAIEQVTKQKGPMPALLASEVLDRLATK